jgi:predicted HTH transcriptional regulator
LNQLIAVKIFHGLKRNIDDAILQDQIKTRVYPIPQFSYAVITYKGLEYGIIEIPLKRYPEPISPVVRMKGLEPGKIYMRRGSSNSEAIGKEVLLIDRWIKSVKLDHDAKGEIDELLKELNSGQRKLSYCISSAYKISNHFQDEDLIRFCKGELSG